MRVQRLQERPRTAPLDPKGAPWRAQGSQKSAQAGPRAGFWSILECKMVRKRHSVQICCEKEILQKSWFYLGNTIDFEGSAASESINFTLFLQISAISVTFCMFLLEFPAKLHLKSTWTGPKGAQQARQGAPRASPGALLQHFRAGRSGCSEDSGAHFV